MSNICEQCGGMKQITIRAEMSPNPQPLLTDHTTLLPVSTGFAPFTFKVCNCPIVQPDQEPKPIELNEMAKSIIGYLLRGYRKGFAVDLNNLEDIWSRPCSSWLAEWTEAIKQLATISESDEADSEIKRLEKLMAERAGPVINR